jgi:hypothetical protein
MRRFLNLNQPGILFLKLIGLFTVMIPAVLYVFLLAFRVAESIRSLLFGVIKVSFVVGALICVVFLVLIIVEQVQDHYFDVQYQKQRDQKIFLGQGDYECQYCGNQKVRENDRICSVCGREFAPHSNLD